MRHGQRYIFPFAVMEVSLFTCPFPVSNLTFPVVCMNWFAICVGIPWSCKAFKEAKSRPAPESAIHESSKVPSVLWFRAIKACSLDESNAGKHWDANANDGKHWDAPLGANANVPVQNLLHRISNTPQSCQAFEE